MAQLALILGFGLWAVLVSIVALLRGEHIRDDRDVATGCLTELVHAADVHDQMAGETARQIAARYDPALRSLPRRSQFPPAQPAKPWTVDLAGQRPMNGVTEGETWLHR